MKQKLNFIGKVIVVTGAGGGLGRQYALLFGQRGASVVVNDLGGSSKGEGESHSAADVVVNEIRAAGGKAVANYDSVENGDKIIKTAIDTYGRVDIVINNAGILRDRAFIKMSDQDWDLIYQVHLLGAFKVTRAAWPYMRDQKYGRIIMTSSSAAVFGNFGQANYSAGKMSLIGLSNTLSIEGSKYNINCNVIIPVAASRMTQDVMPPELFEKLKPEFVAPVVAWLCHEDCSDSGQIFEAAGGWVGKYRWERSQGVAFPANNDMTPEVIRDNWERLSDMTDANKPATVHDDISLIMQALTEPTEQTEDVSDNDDGPAINPEKAMKNTFKPTKFQYETKDAILYALGVGCSTQTDDGLKFLYEGHEAFSVLPTFAIMPAQQALTLLFSGIPGLRIDVTKILHGEQFLEVFKPLAPSMKLQSKSKIVDVLDKGSGAVIIIDVETQDDNNEPIARNQFSIFVVGSGGFGGKRNSDKIVTTVDPPKRTPDAVVRTKTQIDQAAMYRLNGDVNPLHIDANFAAMGGFSKPILHGLCSLGIVSRQVLQQFANNDVSKFKSIKVRFVKPVYPGETIETSMWRDGNRVIFESKAVESGNIIIKGGYIDLTDVIAGAGQKQITKQMDSTTALKSGKVFEEMGKRVSTSPDLIKKVAGCFEWIITKNGSPANTWTIDLKNPPGSVYEGAPKSKADVTLTLDDDDMVAIVSGKLNPQKAFMSGKLKIKGNVMLTQKLQTLFQSGAKL